MSLNRAKKNQIDNLTFTNGLSKGAVHARAVLEERRRHHPSSPLTTGSMIPNISLSTRDWDVDRCSTPTSQVTAPPPPMPLPDAAAAMSPESPRTSGIVEPSQKTSSLEQAAHTIGAALLDAALSIKPRVNSIIVVSGWYPDSTMVGAPIEISAVINDLGYFP